LGGAATAKLVHVEFDHEPFKNLYDAIPYSVAITMVTAMSNVPVEKASFT